MKPLVWAYWVSLAVTLVITAVLPWCSLRLDFGWSGAWFYMGVYPNLFVYPGLLAIGLWFCMRCPFEKMATLQTPFGITSSKKVGMCCLVLLAASIATIAEVNQPKMAPWELGSSSRSQWLMMRIASGANYDGESVAMLNDAIEGKYTFPLSWTHYTYALEFLIVILEISAAFVVFSWGFSLIWRGFDVADSLRYDLLLGLVCVVCWIPFRVYNHLQKQLYKVSPPGGQLDYSATIFYIVCFTMALYLMADEVAKAVNQGRKWKAFVLQIPHCILFSAAGASVISRTPQILNRGTLLGMSLLLILLVAISWQVGDECEKMYIRGRRKVKPK